MKPTYFHYDAMLTEKYIADRKKGKDPGCPGSHNNINVV